MLNDVHHTSAIVLMCFTVTHVSHFVSFCSSCLVQCGFEHSPCPEEPEGSYDADCDPLRFDPFEEVEEEAVAGAAYDRPR